MAMLETPMLYDSLEHAHKAMNGETFKLINKGFPEKSGLTTLNAFPLGFRHFYTKKDIKGVEDLKGLRMRVPNIPLYIEFAKQLGQSGQPMPFAEVPSALDQGTIDGGDSPFSDIVALKMYEIAPTITLSGHILVIHSLYINNDFFNKLPPKTRRSSRTRPTARRGRLEDGRRNREEGDRADHQGRRQDRHAVA